MKVALLPTLLVSICLLHAGTDCTDIPVAPDFDVNRIAGRWYPIARVFRGADTLDIMSTEEILEPSGERDMVLRIHFYVDGSCRVVNFHAVHTETPGIFTVTETGSTIHVVDVDYDSYNIIHIRRTNGFSLYLSSRTQEASDDVKEKFRNHAETLGFDVNQIINPTPPISCP